MKQSLVRGLWGNLIKDPNGSTIRKEKVLADVSRVITAQHKAPFVTYVFGEDNAHLLEDLGLEVRMIDKKPIAWDMKTKLYRHKLEIIYTAMQDYDKIVFLDWDCVLTKEFPNDFWERLMSKSSFQGNLFQYRTKKCLWRDSDWRKVVNGGFLYLSDKQIASDFIENWELLYKSVQEKENDRKSRGLELRFREKSLIFDDEPAISLYVDNQYGKKWPGMDVYWKDCEPSVCKLRKKSAYSEELNSSKDACFMHLL